MAVTEVKNKNFVSYYFASSYNRKLNEKIVYLCLTFSLLHHSPSQSISMSYDFLGVESLFLNFTAGGKTSQMKLKESHTEKVSPSCVKEI